MAYQSSRQKGKKPWRNAATDKRCWQKKDLAKLHILPNLDA